MVEYPSLNRSAFAFIVGLLGLAPLAGLAAETGTLRFEDRAALPAGDPDPAVPSLRAGSGPPVPRPSNMLLDPVPPAGPPARSDDAAAVEAVAAEPGGPADAPADDEGRAVVRRVPSEGTHAQFADQRPIGRRGSTGLSWSFTYLWPLAAVLALIGVLALLIRRFLPNRRFLVGEGAMKIVARTPISAKQTLMLVKLGRRLVMIGVSFEQMSTLAIIDDPDQVAILLGEVASSRPESISSAFARSFRAEAETYQPESIEEAEALDPGQVQGLLKKIRRLTGRQAVG